MRLIDASFVVYAAESEFSEEEAAKMRWLISHIPTVDAVPVVRCKHTMYYLMQNRELLKKHVRDMKLHNRIRYLFKGRLKEDAHGSETGEKHEAQEMADEGPGEAGTEPV